MTSPAMFWLATRRWVAAGGAVLVAAGAAAAADGAAPAVGLTAELVGGAAGPALDPGAQPAAIRTASASRQTPRLTCRGTESSLAVQSVWACGGRVAQ